MVTSLSYFPELSQVRTLCPGFEHFSSKREHFLKKGVINILLGIK